jgi:hypothetical protein
MRERGVIPHVSVEPPTPLYNLISSLKGVNALNHNDYYDAPIYYVLTEYELLLHENLKQKNKSKRA